MLGIRPSTFYRWYERYRAGGPEALEDKPSKPDRVWNRIPNDVRERIVAMGDWKLEIVKRSDTAKGFQLLPRRWVVERTLAWMGRNRRLAKHFECLAATALAYLKLAMIQLMLRRLVRR
jgi:hypothetical protein